MANPFKFLQIIFAPVGDLLGSLLGLAINAPATETTSVAVRPRVSGDAIPIVYGRRETTGVLARADVTNSYSNVETGTGTSGTTATSTNFGYDAILDLCICWAVGEVDAIEGFTVAGEASTVQRLVGHFRAVSRTGTPTQAAIGELVQRYAVATPATRGRGLAWSLISAYYQRGDPQYRGQPSLRARLRGFKVYDPRSTAQQFTRPATWRWSNNPALALLHYLTGTHGLNADINTDIDLPSFIRAANICDEMVTIPARPPTVRANQQWWEGDPGAYRIFTYGRPDPNFRPWQVGTTQARAECDLVVSSGEPRKKVVQNILATMRGWLIWSNGRYVLSLLEAQTPSMDFDVDNMEGEIEVAQQRRQDRMNAVTVRFPNRTNNYDYSTATFPPPASAQALAWEAADGTRRHREITVEGCVDIYRATDLAEAMVRESRRGLRVSFTATQVSAILLEPNDVIRITYPPFGWRHELFAIETVEISEHLSAKITAKEYDQADFSWSGKSVEPPIAPLVPPPGFVFPPVAMLTATPAGTTGIDVQWCPVAGYTGVYAVEYRVAGHPWQSWITGLQPAAELRGLQTNTTYQVRVTYITEGGGHAPYATTATTTVNNPPPPPPPLVQIFDFPSVPIVVPALYRSAEIGRFLLTPALVGVAFITIDLTILDRTATATTLIFDTGDFYVSAVGSATTAPGAALSSAVIRASLPALTQRLVLGLVIPAGNPWLVLTARPRFTPFTSTPGALTIQAISASIAP